MMLLTNALLFWSVFLGRETQVFMCSMAFAVIDVVEPLACENMWCGTSHACEDVLLRYNAQQSGPFSIPRSFPIRQAVITLRPDR